MIDLNRKDASGLRYKDLEADDILFDDQGGFYRVTKREADAWSATYADVIVPEFKISGIQNSGEMSGGGQRPGWRISSFGSANWIWHSRLGCLTA